MNSTIKRIRIKFIAVTMAIALFMMAILVISLNLIMHYLSRNDANDIHSIITSQLNDNDYSELTTVIDLRNQDFKNFHIDIAPDKIKKIDITGTISNTSGADWYRGESRIKYYGLDSGGHIVEASREFIFNKDNTLITLNFKPSSLNSTYPRISEFLSGIYITDPPVTYSSIRDNGSDTYLNLESMEIYYNDYMYALSKHTPDVSDMNTLFNNNIPYVLNTRDFFYMVYRDDSLISVNNGNTNIVSDLEIANNILQNYLSSDNSDDFILTTNNQQTFKCYKTEIGRTTALIFIETDTENAFLHNLTTISIGISAIILIILFITIFFYSRTVSKPLEDAYVKQQQFISDASHELKTPVTVISAVTDVLEDEIGANRWTDSIKGQTKRMMSLVQSLSNLSHNIEAVSEKQPFESLDISNIISNTVLSFDAKAFEAGINLESDVVPNYMVKGNPDKLTQLVTILIDNAIKYSDDNGYVKVLLNSHGLLSVSNPCKDFDIENSDKLFERFYRGDSSHSTEKPGYGLGLPIAVSIIEMHHLKIDLKYEDGVVYFDINLSSLK